MIIAVIPVLSTVDEARKEWSIVNQLNNPENNILALCQSLASAVSSWWGYSVITQIDWIILVQLDVVGPLCFGLVVVI